MNARIGIVAHSAVGGSAMVADRLALLLADAGERVWAFRTRGAGLDHPRVRTRHVDPPAYPVLEGRPWTVAMAGAIADVVDAEALDVLHVHYALPYAASAWMALQMVARRPRFVVTVHGTDVTGVGADPTYRRTLRAALLAADVVTAPSKSLAARAACVFGLERPPIVVPNFVSGGDFSPEGPRAANGAELRIAHVSNYRPVKRAPLLADILHRVRATTPARLVLIGEGPERSAVLARAEALGVRDAIDVVGHADDPTPWLRASQVFVLPSAEESFGLSALEAMACGLPVVATAVGGLPELVRDGVCGHLVAPEDLEGFAARVVALLANPEAASAMGARGRERALNTFPPTRALALYRSAYGLVDPAG